MFQPIVVVVFTCIVPQFCENSLSMARSSFPVEDNAPHLGQWKVYVAITVQDSAVDANVVVGKSGIDRFFTFVGIVCS